MASRLNAFNGVFVPTFLSIIGVILYLRLGSIVGSAGILGAILIILLAASVTIATGLSISSITTNIRIGSGGAYAIISKTLGLEVGGSVGIPLYLAQIFSTVFYLFGFSEAWRFIFPQHSFIVVSLAAFLFLFLLTSISTNIAIKAQVFIFLLVVVSLVSVLMGGDWFSATSAPIWGSFPDLGFWGLFALFFPAVTGVMAGVGMSGDLEDPKRQIPKGLLSAIIVTTLVYIVFVIWIGQSADSATLLSDNLILVKLGLYAPLALAGIIAATFSSALTTIVAAPRLLQSMGNNGVLPGSTFFAKKTKNGEPRNAAFITSALILGGIFMGSLDTIAPLLTMFFLLGYAMVNFVVFLEQSLGLVSFRPTLSVPKLVPLYGAIGSIVFMFLINTIAGAIALAFLVVTYVWLIHRKLKPRGGDVRSGLFLAISEWAAKKVLKLPESTKHTWKPNLLLPVATTRTVLGNFPLVKAISYPHGTLTVLGLDLRHRASSPEEGVTKLEVKKSLKELPGVVEKFGEEGIFTSFSTVRGTNYVRSVTTSLEAIESQLFHPNILFLPFKANRFSTTDIKRIFSTAKSEASGVILFDRDTDIGLGTEEDVHVWIKPAVLKLEFYDDKRNFDLALLIAYRLHSNWKGKIHLWSCVAQEQKQAMESYLKKLVYEARFPSSTVVHVSSQGFMRTLMKAPQGDIHIIPVKGEEDVSKLAEISKKMSKSFLFVLDSGKEDIMA